MHNTLLKQGKSILICATLLLPAWSFAADPVYFETDFSGYELGNVHGQHGWTENTTPSETYGYVTIVESGKEGAPASPSGTDHFLKVLRPNSATAPWGHQTFLDYSGALRGGKIRLTYTAALDWGSNFTVSQVTLGGSAMGANGIKTGFHYGESTGATNRYLYVQDKNGVYHYLDANPDVEGLSGITRNVFYRFDIILDIDTKDYTVSVYDMDDRKLDSISLNDWSRASEEIMFNRVRTGMSGGSLNDTMYIDQILVTVPESGAVALGLGLIALLATFAGRVKRRRGSL